MLIGYLSLAPEQLAGGLSAPHNALISCGVGSLYIDVKTGGDARPQLDAALAEISKGGVLVSPTVNTLTDSIAGLLGIHARLEAKGASLRLLELAGGLPLDTSTGEGRAILSALAVMNALPPIAGAARHSAAPASPFAALLPRADEQRQRGRPVTAGNHANEINRLRAQGLRAVEIAACLGIGRASVYRILSQGQPADVSPARSGNQADREGGMSSRIVGRFVGAGRV
jgi:DNA invertase Pin-like site-specific DNA recombinase